MFNDNTHQLGAIESIPSSKVVAKPEFTKDEQRAIMIELKQQSEQFRKHDEEEFARILKPWDEMSKRAQRTQHRNPPMGPLLVRQGLVIREDSE